MFCFKNKKEISEDVGAAAGTTVRHAGLKVAAVILAGVVGGGGVTYGVVKNADKIPVIQNFVEENDAPVVKVAEKPKEEEKTESIEEPEVEVTEPAEEKPVDHTPVKTENNEKEDIIPTDVRNRCFPFIFFYLVKLRFIIIILPYRYE